MQIITLLFITMHFFYLFNANKLYYFLQRLLKILADKKAHPEQAQIIFVDSSSVVFLVYLLLDFAYLLYCLSLIFGSDFWQPGAMLFIISALETYAFHARISHTYIVDDNNFIYPQAWCRCILSGCSLFILMNLYQNF